MSNRDGGPAFATPSVFDADGLQVERGDCGMSLRDYFAGHAMVGLLSAGEGDGAPYTEINGASSFIAEWAYELADAMIKERDNP
jgi:hypothetical protein